MTGPGGTRDGRRALSMDEGGQKGSRRAEGKGPRPHCHVGPSGCLRRGGSVADAAAVGCQMMHGICIEGSGENVCVSISHVGVVDVAGQVSYVVGWLADQPS